MENPPGTHHCPLCGKLINDNYPHCPYCYKPPQVVTKNKAPIVFTIGCASVLLLLIIGYVKACSLGPKLSEVHNSTWDASVTQVVDYLKVNLKDPDSYQSINWSKVQDFGPSHTTLHRYLVRHKYRAKNSFGGYVISNQLFYLDDNGAVINTKDIPE